VASSRSGHPAGLRGTHHDQPKSLIINSPYERPAFYWREDRGSLVLETGRRPAGYEIFDTRQNTRRTQPLGWSTASASGSMLAGGPVARRHHITRSLLEHWHERAVRQLPFYFCQLEAIETLIWWVKDRLTSSRASPYLAMAGLGAAVLQDGHRLRQDHPDGDDHYWQVLNAVTYPKRNKTSRARCSSWRRGSRSRSASRCSTRATRQQLRRVLALSVEAHAEKSPASAA